MKKVIVLDLNRTILYKSRQRLRHDQEYFTIGSHYYIYMRPHLQQLIDLLHNKRITYGFWSTAKRHNTEKMVDLLKRKGFTQSSFVLSQENCSVGEFKEHDVKADAWVKNLDVLDEYFEEYEAVLVDDSPSKSMPGQNYINVEKFEGDHEDIFVKDMCLSILYFLDN